jgi:hypothetical protein
MGENARSRRQLVALGVLGYGLVFAGLCPLQAPAIAIAAYFVIPTALVAIAGPDHIAALRHGPAEGRERRPGSFGR